MDNTELNLHKLSIPSDIRPDEPVFDHSEQGFDVTFGQFEVVLRNQENRLIEIIKENKGGAIFGCIAWLTSRPILQALSLCENVQIIVQKEDFLRPDMRVRNGRMQQSLRPLYDSLKCGYCRYEMRDPINSLSVCGDPCIDPVRCLGNFNSDKNPAFPRMHHKFLVFCRIDKTVQQGFDYMPIAVWTGSYNLTYNATMSFENNIYMVDRSGNNKFIHSYLFEHHQLFALSESLDWTSKWCAPEYRIGS